MYMTTCLHFHHKWAFLDLCVSISNTPETEKVLRIDIVRRGSSSSLLASHPPTPATTNRVTGPWCVR